MWLCGHGQMDVLDGHVRHKKRFGPVHNVMDGHVTSLCLVRATIFFKPVYEEPGK